MSARKASVQPPNKRRAVLQGFSGSNHHSIPVYASRILLDKKSEVAGIPGEHGNPWVLPWNPDKVQVSQSASSNQYGLCGWAQAYVPPTVVDFWFAFLADTTGLWNFLALVDSFGYYLLNANRGFLLCRDSRVKVSASVNVYQYFWFVEKNFPILDEDSDTGFKYGFIEESGEYDFQAFLRADPDYYVFLLVTMTIDADAYGSGSWSEINFKDGEANYIKPLLLVAYPST